MRLNSKHPTYKKFSSAYGNEDYKLAEFWIRECLREVLSSPEDPDDDHHDVWFCKTMLATMLARQGRQEEARNVALELMRPEDPSSVLEYAEFNLRELKDYRRSATIARKALRMLKAGKLDPELSANAHYQECAWTAAFAFYLGGKKKRAKRLLDKVFAAIKHPVPSTIQVEFFDKCLSEADYVSEIRAFLERLRDQVLSDVHGERCHVRTESDHEVDFIDYLLIKCDNPGYQCPYAPIPFYI